MKKKTYYKAFLGQITKKGKKNKAKNILDNTLATVSANIELNVDQILRYVINKSSTILETKEKRIGRNIFTIPVPVSKRRRRYLCIQNILSSVRSEKAKIPFTDKLSAEIINILLERDTKTVAKSQDNLRLVLSNRANTHYRWTL